MGEEQVNVTQSWDLGAIASTMSVADIQAAADCLRIILPTSTLYFIFFGHEGLKYWYGLATGRSSPQGTCSPSTFHRGVEHGVGSVISHDP